MSGFFVRITGQRSAPFGSNRKEGAIISIKGHELIDINRRILCREGTEEPVPAPAGVMCKSPSSSFPHKIKQGDPMYDLGLFKVCKTHIYSVPTLEMIKKEYGPGTTYANIKIVPEK